MKSLTAVCPTGASMPPINANGRVSRPPHHRGDGENAEMKMYLSKLKDLVPFMPKNRKLSKLEIIQHVIDYICDLQSELETHPDIGNFDAATALNLPTNGELLQQMANGEDLLAERLAAEQHQEIAQQQQQQQHAQQQQYSSPATRQPLVDRPAPNTILPVNGHSSAGILQALQMQQLQQQQQQQQQSLAAMQQNSETTTTEKDSRPTAC